MVRYLELDLSLSYCFYLLQVEFSLFLCPLWTDYLNFWFISFPALLTNFLFYYYDYCKSVYGSHSLETQGHLLVFLGFSVRAQRCAVQTLWFQVLVGILQQCSGPQKLHPVVFQRTGFVEDQIKIDCMSTQNVS